MKFSNSSFYKDQKKACRHFKKKANTGYMVSLVAFLAGLGGLLINQKRAGYQNGVSDALDEVDEVILNVEPVKNDEGEES